MPQCWSLPSSGLVISRHQRVAKTRPRGCRPGGAMLRCPTDIATRGRLSTILQFLWRYLVLPHRWVGVLLCLMFVAWFASALAIIYVKFPELSAAEQRSGAAALNLLDIR